MKYYSLIIKTYNNGTADKTSLYTHDTRDEALASCYTNFGQNLGAETIHSVMCMALSGEGVVYENKYWVEAEPEPEAE